MLADEPWRLSLLGGLRAARGEVSVTRFRTRKTAALLALLAFSPRRAFSREELADRLWPDDPPETGRSNLRQSLASLRRQLEPPGTPSGSVFFADRTYLRLQFQAFRTDVAEFEACAASDSSPERLARAAALYCGELLPGFYDDWILTERERLALLHARVLARLPGLLAEAGNLDAALNYAARSVAADPLDEARHIALMRLSMQANQPALARRQFAVLTRTLRDELGEEPSAEARAVLDSSAPHPALRAPLSLTGERAMRATKERSNRARDCFEAMLSVMRRSGHQGGVVLALACLSSVAIAQGAWESARLWQRETLEIKSALGDKLGIAYALKGFAELAQTERDSVRAVRLFSAATTLSQTLEAGFAADQQADRDRNLTALRAELGEIAFARAHAEDSALSWEQAIALALQESPVFSDSGLKAHL